LGKFLYISVTGLQDADGLVPMVICVLYEWHWWRKSFKGDLDEHSNRFFLLLRI